MERRTSEARRLTSSKTRSLGGYQQSGIAGNLKSKGSRSRPYLKTGPFGSSLKGEHWVGVGEGVPVVTIGAIGRRKHSHEGVDVHQSSKSEILG